MSRILKKPWIESFLEYTKDTEIPTEYLKWAAISIIASTLKRNVYLWYRGIKFQPNQYIIFVGPPGIGKDEAINKVLDIAKETKTVNILNDWHTPQEVIEEISTGWGHVQLKVGQVMTAGVIEDHTCCIIAPELAVFLQQYDNLHSLMCSWWNKDTFEYKTKNKGKHSIENMSVSLLGGCVPDFIRSLSKDRMAPITGGFTARTIFVYATEKSQLIKNSFGIPSTVISKLKQDLINDLIEIGKLKGQISVSKEAAKLWEEIYEEHNKRGIIDSDASTNFKSRISSHIIKTAITTCVSESDTLIITRDQLDRAIGYVEQVRDKVDIVFRCVGESPLAVTMNKVQTYIDSVGMCSYKTLLRVMYRDATEDQLNAILTVLDKTGLVITKIVGRDTEYWSTNGTQNKKQGVVNP